MNDRTLSKHHGKLFTVSDKVIGQGAYGCVYLGKDEYGNHIAIKCCELKKDGIPSIFEANIMQTICHPNINSSIEIVASTDFLYIIQSLAVTDLYNYTNMNKLNYIFTVTELQIIFFNLLQAVAILHSEQIIHCDIKSSNVLLYADGSVKLTDFTLSTKKIKDTMYGHTVCTATHRDLAIHLKHKWDEKIDLWSLGCTFYEIAYNQLLFKHQSINKNEDKNNLKYKFINAIIDWAHYTHQTVDTPLYNVDYVNIGIVDKYNDPSFLPLNNIINQLLFINPELRPTAIDLLKDPIFNTYEPINPKFVVVQKETLAHTEEARIVRYIQQLTNNKEVQLLALDIYKKINLSLSEYHKAVGCTYIALKILIGTHESLFAILNADELLGIERDICHDLHFRLC